MGPRKKTTSPPSTPKALAVIAEQVDAARSRGAVKTLGKAVDADARLRQDVVDLATHRGIEVDPSWPGKKLVRAARGRESESRVRTNPIRRDQSYACTAAAR